jgi:mono/diheme cytochrome c family protein
MKCCLTPSLRAGIALFTISLAISGCEGGQPQMPAGLLTSRQAQAAGSALFSAHCAICHGAKGDGNGVRREGMNPPPANLTLPPWSEAASAPHIYRVIRGGVRGTAMAAWPALSDGQVWDLVAFIHTLKSH